MFVNHVMDRVKHVMVLIIIIAYPVNQDFCLWLVKIFVIILVKQDIIIILLNAFNVIHNVVVVMVQPVLIANLAMQVVTYF